MFDSLTSRAKRRPTRRGVWLSALVLVGLLAMLIAPVSAADWADNRVNSHDGSGYICLKLSHNSYVISVRNCRGYHCPYIRHQLARQKDRTVGYSTGANKNDEFL